MRLMHRSEVALSLIFTHMAVRRGGGVSAQPLEHGHIPCGTSFVMRMPNDRRFLKAALPWR